MKRAAIILGLGVAFMLLGSTTSAQSERPNLSVSVADESSRQALENDHKATSRARLAEAKLKFCPKHEAAVQRIMDGIVARGAKRLAVIDKIAERTEAFYTKKGYLLSNYDTLVSEMTAKRAAAAAALEMMRADGHFSCSAASPKGVAGTFKESLFAEKSALKAYQTAVKNLIVGVKSVRPQS